MSNCSSACISCATVAVSSSRSLGLMCHLMSHSCGSSCRIYLYMRGWCCGTHVAAHVALYLSPYVPFYSSHLGSRYKSVIYSCLEGRKQTRYRRVLSHPRATGASFHTHVLQARPFRRTHTCSHTLAHHLFTMPSKYKKKKDFEGSGDDSMRVGAAAACLQGTPYLLSLLSPLARRLATR